MPRKKYDTDFKTKVILEILKEEKTLSQLASEYGVHVNQLRQWRDIALENWPRAFEPENKQLAKIRSEYEDKIQELYAEVGRLSTQLSWLEKISPRSVERTGWLSSTSKNVNSRSPFRPSFWA